MKCRLVLLIYNVLLPVGLVLALPGAWRKMRRRGGAGRDFSQRFGRYRPEVRARLSEGTDLWIHAVSVGEVNVAMKLVRTLHQERPGLRVVLTTTTTTGHAVATAWAPDEVMVLYSPVDLPGVVRRVLGAVRPSAIVLVEAEVWPNLVAEAARRGIPVTLANARLSPRSRGRFMRFRVLVGPVFALLDRVLVQEPDDVGTWEALGVAAERVRCVGSVKFDPQGAAVPEVPAEFRGRLESLWGAPLPAVVLAASTHDGEERLLAEAVHLVREGGADARLAVVPRHFERAGEVAADLAAAGFASALRSGGEHRPDPEAVFVVDSTGELSGWIGLATVVVIGKSFLSKGGQNPVEAVLAGKPVVFGPEMQNFEPLATQLVEAGGAVRVDAPDTSAIAVALRDLLSAEGRRQKLAANASAALAPHAGAAERSAKAILERLR